MGDSTCIAKIPVDPTQAINHIQIGRAHRWVEVPPGSTNSLLFYVRDSNGALVDLEEEGASMSFVCTIAPRD